MQPVAKAQLKELVLIPVERDGTVATGKVIPPEVIEICHVSAVWFGKVGYQPPWVGYLAFDQEECVGTCAFKSAPKNRSAEIAYGTLKGREGRGVATQMARQLITLARQIDPEILITAQTLPENNASGRVLGKLGFVRVGEVQHAEDGLVWEWHLK